LIATRATQDDSVLSVAHIKAQARNIRLPLQEKWIIQLEPTAPISLSSQAEFDVEAHSIIATARAVAKRTHIKAKVSAHAMSLAVEAEADAIRIWARADADVGDAFAQEMGRRRQGVARVAAFRNKDVFVPAEVMSVASRALAGIAAGVGAELRK
jgi:hypothetical protein